MQALCWGVMVVDKVTRHNDLYRCSKWAQYSGVSYRQRCLDISWVVESSAGTAVLTWNVLDSSRRAPWVGPITLIIKRTFLICVELELKSAALWSFFSFHLGLDAATVLEGTEHPESIGPSCLCGDKSPKAEKEQDPLWGAGGLHKIHKEFLTIE